MQAAFALFLQFAMISLAMAEDVSAQGHGNAWKYGSGGGIIGLIVFILDVVVAVEILKSSRPTTHKVLWLLAVFFFPIVGLIAYWLFSNRASHNSGSGYESIA